MGLRQFGGRLGHTEIPVNRVVTQASDPEIFLLQMADDEALLGRFQLGFHAVIAVFGFRTPRPP